MEKTIAISVNGRQLDLHGIEKEMFLKMLAKSAAEFYEDVDEVMLIQNIITHILIN